MLHASHDYTKVCSTEFRNSCVLTTWRNWEAISRTVFALAVGMSDWFHASAAFTLRRQGATGNGVSDISPNILPGLKPRPRTSQLFHHHHQWLYTPCKGPWPPHTRRFHNLIKTRGRIPLDEWSARRKVLYLYRTTQLINTRDKHPCSHRDSNPRPQQPSGRRPTP
jgi:hypothetical protein